MHGDFYLLEKGEWFLHKSVLPRQPGDPEYQETAPGWMFYYEPHRNADAIPIFEEAVKAAESDEDIMRAYVGLVTAQARTQVDYHPVLYQFKTAIGNPGLWEKGLLVMCDNLTGDNIVSDSLPNQNPAAAEEIYTILISNGRNPVWLREAHWLKARMQRFWNKRDEAIETLKAMVKLGNAKEDTGGRLMGTGLVLLGKLMMEKQNYAGAEEALAAVVYDPTTYSRAPRQEAYGRYIQLLYDTRRLDEAVELSERSVKEDKKDPYWSGFIQVWTARAENGRGHSSKAREILSRIDKATEDQGLINEASLLLKDIR